MINGEWRGVLLDCNDHTSMRGGISAVKARVNRIHRNFNACNTLDDSTVPSDCTDRAAGLPTVDAPLPLLARAFSSQLLSMHASPQSTMRTAFHDTELMPTSTTCRPGSSAFFSNELVSVGTCQLGTLMARRPSFRL